MPKIVEMKMGQGTVFVEVTEPAEDYDTYRSGESRGVIEKIDQAFDRVIQHQIIEHCKILTTAFEQLQDEPIRPKKASAEFGLQFNGQGNVYVAKVGAQASFKSSFEWDSNNPGH